MAHGIKALFLDEAIIFTAGNAGSPLHEGAEKLMIRLQHSGLLLGLYHRYSSLPGIKSSTLQEIGVSKAIVSAGPGEARRLASEWGVCNESCLFLCGEDGDHWSEFSENGWRVAKVASSGSGFNLASVPQIIVKLNMQVGEFIVVGHCMKWSREKDLLQRGAMPILATKSGLAFVPVDLHSSLEEQLDLLSIVLNKATDEIVSVSGAPSVNSSGWIQFSESFQKLENFLSARPKICVVDPTHKVMPLMDRVATQMILQNLEHIQTSGGGAVRGPRHLKVTSFEAPDLESNLEASKLKLPTIVKAQIACGPSESHRMAIVFEKQGYKGLSVSLPAVIQEYVDHQSTIFKFYVLGDQVFFSTRKSTPDAFVLHSKASGAPVILFDSLKSLPTGDCVPGLQPDFMAMKEAAATLRDHLGLTIMGFDVVIQSGTQDHVIVDINYFPTFKDVPDAEALPAFWSALQESRTRWLSD